MALHIEELTRYVTEQNNKRDLWEGNDDPVRLSEMLKEEAEELVDSLNDAMVTDNTFEVASEIGDVGYLLIRLCDSLGIDLLEAIEMKTVRNSQKYPDHLMSNGRNYQEATQTAKEVWRAKGGDAAWSHLYLDYLAAEYE